MNRPDVHSDGSTGRSPATRETRVVHAGAPRPRSGEPVVPPLVQSATFFSGGPGDVSPIYTRYGTNPNQVQVAERVASLEGMEAGLAVGSGMAAITLTILSLVEAEDHVVASDRLYGATRDFLTTELARRGVDLTLVDAERDGAWAAALRPRTRLLYLETPTNPMLRLFDPEPVADVAAGAGIPLVVDATFASPVNFRSGERGAELVVHSGTKYLGGHSDLIGGVVAGPRHRIDAVGRMLRLYGPALDPHAAWLLDRGIRTLDVRVRRQNRNALGLAEWFAGLPQVERVVYPGLSGHPDHALARELLDGFGGMLGIVLRGGPEAADTMCRRLELVGVAPSLGGVETLVSLPRLTSHQSLSADERDRAGIPDGFVRISVGIEGLEDLKGDFLRSLT
jgi:cystathionine beta-lyase/cystathionine gamma-synthase